MFVRILRIMDSSDMELLSDKKTYKSTRPVITTVYWAVVVGTALVAQVQKAEAANTQNVELLKNGQDDIPSASKVKCVKNTVRMTFRY